jgi:hypothetical protein
MRLKTITVLGGSHARYWPRLWAGFQLAFPSTEGLALDPELWCSATPRGLLIHLTAPEPASVSVCFAGDVFQEERSVEISSWTSSRTFTATWRREWLPRAGEWGDWEPMLVTVDFGFFGSTSAAWDVVGSYVMSSGGTVWTPGKIAEYMLGEIPVLLGRRPMTGSSEIEERYFPELQCVYFEPSAKLTVLEGSYSDEQWWPLVASWDQDHDVYRTDFTPSGHSDGETEFRLYGDGRFSSAIRGALRAK